MQDACHRGPRLRPWPWRRRPMGAQALVGPLAGLTAPLVSSVPTGAKLLGCDGWGPRAPPSIPSSSQAPGQGWATPYNQCFPATLGLGWAGPSGEADRQHAALLWPEYPTGQGGVPRRPGASLDSSPIPGGLRGGAGIFLVGGGCTCLTLLQTHPQDAITHSLHPARSLTCLHPPCRVDQTLDSTPTPRAEPRDAPSLAFPGLA